MSEKKIDALLAIVNWVNRVNSINGLFHKAIKEAKNDRE
jgi:hypothetical protein